MGTSRSLAAILFSLSIVLPLCQGFFFKFTTVGLLNGLANQAINFKGKIGVAPTAFCYLEVSPTFFRNKEPEYKASLWCPVISAYAKTSATSTDKTLAVTEAVNSYAEQATRYGLISEEEANALIDAYLNNPSSLALF